MPARRGKARGETARVSQPRLQLKGWLSTDEEEIERRRHRAATEPLRIVALEPEHPVFGTFRVSSEAGSAYDVEIRSLEERLSSCGCPDHQVNGLGTCKHVEAVLAHVRKSRQARGGPPRSPRIEIYLHRAGPVPEVRALWPDRSGRLAARPVVAEYFAEDGTLRNDPSDPRHPVTALTALARELAAAPPRIRLRIRLSRHLSPWVEDQRRRAARDTARAQLAAQAEADPTALDVVKLPLFPYQREGMLHLAFTERAMLADEMGLGKTVQAIAACELLRRLRGIERVLVISPASLKGEWEEQIARFTDLPSRIISGMRAQRLRQLRGEGDRAFFYLMNYEQILADGEEVQQRLAPDVIILDEAQRIKNWQSRTAQAVKRLRSPYAFVLTGTPLENRIDEVYSIVQFLDPALLGPLFRFNRDFYQLDDRGRPAGYKNLDELHRRLAPILLRRRKDEVEGQLPGRTDKHYFVPMEDEQAARYDDYEKRVAKLAAVARRRPLTPAELDKLQRWLGCMRMLCDTPYILDSDCRVCPKLSELMEILPEVLTDPHSKILIFSEWERMLELVRELALGMDVGFAWHTGSVPQARRREEVRRFKTDPGCRLFLSTDSGGVGLNLQAANVVINLDLPWNPARLEQRIARAWRKHQTRPVQVIYLVTENSIEQRMIPLLAGKQALADTVIDARGGQTAMPLPSGRKALVARLEALTGLTLAATPATTPEAAAQAGPPEPEEASPASSRPEGVDEATVAAIQRLAEAGLLELTEEGLRRLGLATPSAEPGRDHRLPRSRELFAQAERKLRMAAVLAGSGFAVESLPALREGLELGLRSQAHLEGQELSEAEAVSLEWIESRLPQHFPLIRKLRSESEALLGAQETEAQGWLAAVEQIAGEIRTKLAQG